MLTICRLAGQRLDVLDRVDRRVPGDAVAGSVSSTGPGLLGHVRVLDPGVGEGDDQLRVELGVGLDVDDGALVEALEVERVDGAGRDQLRDQLVGPVVGRIELEAEGRGRGRACAAGVSIVEGSPVRPARAASSRRRSPGCARGRAASAMPIPAWRRREVERGGLEGPAPVAARDVPLRARPGRCRRRHEVAELAEVAWPVRSRSAPGVLERDLVERVVGDVLAEARPRRPLIVDHGREPFEARCDVSSRPSSS